MHDRHPILRFFLCALAIWPIPHQIAEQLFSAHPLARLSGPETLDGEEPCASMEWEAQ